jgi:hypothetical protein
MIKIIHIIVAFSCIGISVTGYTQTNTFSAESLMEDFDQFRSILENNHCCLYEYMSKTGMDSLFDSGFRLIKDNMRYEEFFTILSQITSRIGCMHTATWMPGRYFITKPDMILPVRIKLIDNNIVVAGSYVQTEEIPCGSLILSVNSNPSEEILTKLRSVTSADALNPYFVDAQIEKRFPVFYASVYGLPDEYSIKYIIPTGKDTLEIKVNPADYESVRNGIFSNFMSPPLGFRIIEGMNTAILKVPTFIYYDKVDYFRSFMDSCFNLVKEYGITNLILDVRGNDGGDPFCSSILLTYLQMEPVPYFAEEYGKYKELSNPLPLPEDRFTGNLYTLIDGSCGSTNGHFCALLKYHKIGKLIGTPTGATYKCNAGKNTEFRLKNTQMILTIGRSTYSAAVENMAKTAILPDIYIHETYDDFINKRDAFIEEVFVQIETNNQ